MTDMLTKDETTFRAFMAGVLSGKMMNAEGVEVVHAHVEIQGEPPRIELEVEGCALEIIVLSAHPPRERLLDDPCDECVLNNGAGCVSVACACRCHKRLRKNNRATRPQDAMEKT